MAENERSSLLVGSDTSCSCLRSRLLTKAPSLCAAPPGGHKDTPTVLRALSLMNPEFSGYQTCTQGYSHVGIRSRAGVQPPFLLWVHCVSPPKRCRRFPDTDNLSATLIFAFLAHMSSCPLVPNSESLLGSSDGPGPGHVPHPGPVVKFLHSHCESPE